MDPSRRTLGLYRWNPIDKHGAPHSSFVPSVFATWWIQDFKQRTARSKVGSVDSSAPSGAYLQTFTYTCARLGWRQCPISTGFQRSSAVCISARTFHKHQRCSNMHHASMLIYVSRLLCYSSQLSSSQLSGIGPSGAVASGAGAATTGSTGGACRGAFGFGMMPAMGAVVLALVA